MRPRTARLVIAACLCAAFGADADVSAQAPAKARNTAVISGRILAADTGLPLRGARVRVYGSGPNVPSGPDARRATITDANGAFSFTDLPAGRYHLEARKARYVDGEFGAPRPKPIEVTAGQKVENITVSLAVGGVITGRVLDDLGEPVADARVESLGAFAGPNGSRQLAAMGMSATTDDTGTYRLHGLSPGTYYVSAHDDTAMRYMSGAASTTPGFGPTFFPGTAAAAEAQPIEVVAGGEAVADITLVLAKLAIVSGVVMNAAGAPATGGSVQASPGPGLRGLGGRDGNASIKPDGTFVLPALAPGEYTVQARPTFEPGGPFASAEAPMHRRSVSTPVVVTGEPVTGLRIVLPDPIRIPVAVTFEDATAMPRDVSVSAYSERMGADASSMRGADGRLTLEVSPGTWRFSAYAPQPWMVKRIAYRGDDVLDVEEVDVTGEPGGRLEVVFTTKSATVTGSVRDATGKPIADYILFLATPKGDPSDPASYDPFMMVPPDQNGRFKAERLRPGTYLFFATEEATPDKPGLPFPELQRRGLKNGRVLRLHEGETITLELMPLP